MSTAAVIDLARLTPEQLAPLYREYRRRHADRLVWIYAIQAGGEAGPIKIGVTRKPWERLQTLQQGNHLELTGLATWRDFPQVEKLIHEEYAHARIRGEWFEPAPDLVEHVLSMGRVFCDWEKPTDGRRL